MVLKAETSTQILSEGWTSHGDAVDRQDGPPGSPANRKLSLDGLANSSRRWVREHPRKRHKRKPTVLARHGRSLTHFETVVIITPSLLKCACGGIFFLLLFLLFLLLCCWNIRGVVLKSWVTYLLLLLLLLLKQSLCRFKVWLDIVVEIIEVSF